MTRGLRQIVRFNWPFYVGATVAVAGAAVATTWVPMSASLRILLYVAIGLGGFWTAASLAVSWIVYDQSALTRWTWIRQALGIRPRSWINIHAGVDESTPALQALMPESQGRVFDIFDPVEMTEASILRARRLAQNAIDPEAVDFRHLPASAGTCDAAMMLLSAHELRTDAARGALLAEVHRVLAPGGRAIVAEHLRDWANVAAFGPGALHFHSARTWRLAFAGARLAVEREFSITPFVHVFVLRRLA